MFWCSVCISCLCFKPHSLCLSFDWPPCLICFTCASLTLPLLVSLTLLPSLVTGSLCLQSSISSVFLFICFFVFWTLFYFAFVSAQFTFICLSLFLFFLPLLTFWPLCLPLINKSLSRTCCSCGVSGTTHDSFSLHLIQTPVCHPVVGHFWLGEGFTFTAVTNCKSRKCNACPAFVFGPSRLRSDLRPTLYQNSLSFFMMKSDEI